METNIRLFGDPDSFLKMRLLQLMSVSVCEYCTCSMHMHDYVIMEINASLILYDWISSAEICCSYCTTQTFIHFGYSMHEASVLFWLEQIFFLGYVYNY